MKKSISRFEYHQTLVKELASYCAKQLPFSSEHASETDKEFIETLTLVATTSKANEDYFFAGQNLIARVVANYSHITPLIHRDLFWYFGGDCLHFMSDEEMNLYNEIDEMIYDSEKQGLDADYAEAKARVFKLH